MKKYEVTLPTQEQPFTHFDLNLELKEKECLAHFNIESMQNLSGTLEELEQSLDKINLFIASLGKNDLYSCSTMVNLIFKMANQALTIFQQDYAYIILRASVPHDAFKLPRWHQDGYYFHPFAGQPLKAAIPLLGPGTLFYSPISSELEEFKEIGESDNGRQKRAELLIDDSRKESTPHHHGSLFIVGSEAGAIHSEPNINAQRFFMSVLPGSKKDIQDYDARQKLITQMQKEGKSFEEIIAASQVRIASELEERNTSMNLSAL